MKNGKLTLRNKIVGRLNTLYSRVWIKVTGTDKFVYRDHSLIHKALVSLYKF